MNPQGVSFQGPRWSLVGLLVKNLFLGLSTLGIYRFWAKTHVRRYFWSNIRVSGEAFEYVGRGMELFIGFLIALAILVPIGLTYAGVQAAMIGQSAWVSVPIDIVYYVGLFFLMQLAIYRARRYRLTRTAWRGIRFGLDGTALRYALVSIGHGILAFLTLGFTYPWRRVALTRMLTENARFGNRHFAFAGQGRELLKAWLPAMLANWGLLIPYGWIIYRFVALVSGNPNEQEMAERISAFQWGAMDWAGAGIFTAFVFVTAVCYTLYRVREFNYMAGKMALGDTVFSASLKARRVFWLYIAYWFMVIVGSVAAIGAIGFAVASSAGLAGDAAGAIVGFGAILFVVLFLPIIKMAWLDYGLLREACRSIEVQNAAALETIVQDSKDTPQFGEGLADALDVGGI